MLYTLYELVQLCLHACNYCPHLNGLSRLVWRSPSGAQRGSFQLCIFQPCHFKKMYYRLAALVNVMPFSPVWEELQPWRWSKNPSSETNRRPGILRNGNRWTNNKSCSFFFFLFPTFERDREKWYRCNRLCSIDAIWLEVIIALHCHRMLNLHVVLFYDVSTLCQFFLVLYIHLVS